MCTDQLRFQINYYESELLTDTFKDTYSIRVVDSGVARKLFWGVLNFQLSLLIKYQLYILQNKRDLRGGDITRSTPG
jgi:hypothetical protein